MNANTTTAKNLQRVYTTCLDAKVKAWLAPDSLNESQEFCTDEKFAWMEHLRVHLPTEYKNLMKLDQMNF